MNLEIKKS